jgi:hypothetical protein
VLPKSINLWRVLSEPFGAVLINGHQSSFPVFSNFFRRRDFRNIFASTHGSQEKQAKFALNRSQAGGMRGHGKRLYFSQLHAAAGSPQIPSVTIDKN